MKKPEVEALVGYQDGFPSMASCLVLLKADTILLWHQSHLPFQTWLFKTQIEL